MKKNKKHSIKLLNCSVKKQVDLINDLDKKLHTQHNEMTQYEYDLIDAQIDAMRCVLSLTHKRILLLRK